MTADPTPAPRRDDGDQSDDPIEALAREDEENTLMELAAERIRERLEAYEKAARETNGWRWGWDEERKEVADGCSEGVLARTAFLAGYSAAIEAAAKVADEMERCERGFQDLAARSQDAQRASDFEEGASIAKTIAAAVRALSPEEKT